MSAITNLSNIITQMTTSTSPAVTPPNVLNRYSGGQVRQVQPYVSGYWYFLVRPPQVLFAGDTAQNSGIWMQATAESFTPPTKTLTKVDIPGMGGVASSFVAGQELSRTFTVAFREYQGLPIMSALQLWTNVIDSRTGISPTLNFAPNEYKGDCYVALCRPTINDASKALDVADIEQMFHFEGVFPETLPYDTLTSDISTNDSAQLSVTFSFDGWPAMKDDAVAMSQFLVLSRTQQLISTSITETSTSSASVKPAGPNFFA